MKFLNLSRYSIKISRIVFVEWSEDGSLATITVCRKKGKLKRMLLQKENENDQIYENNIWRLRQVLET